ncbi:MAG: toll/interleukin receptor protein [Segetibacter sp.]|nr:toll/interleukin receptor protein [Segetibacter sp.]
MIQNKEEKFTNLLSYLNKAELLFLGCNFPDWFFRFFIRVCVGDRLDSVSTIERKTVIDSLNNIDSSRSVFINHYKIQALNMDCNTLIDEIFKSFWKDKEGSSHILTDEANNNVFISYCRQDEQVAKDIASQFDEKFIEYFLDESDLEPGDQLNDKITQAIDKCCLFLPIISTNIQEASRYIWREWQYAITKSSEVWPVFKEFVDRDMLLPVEYGITAELRDRFLNRNVTIGAALNGGVENEIAKRGNLLEEKKLRDIKKKQYDSRVCGKRK